MLPEFYNQLGTMDGTIMVFLGIVPLAVGAFGNYIIPLQIGAPDMVPRATDRFRRSFALFGVIPADLCIWRGPCSFQFGVQTARERDLEWPSGKKCA